MDDLLRLVNGYQVTQAIHLAAVLGLADLLAERPALPATTWPRPPLPTPRYAVSAPARPRRASACSGRRRLTPTLPSPTLGSRACA